MKLTVTINLKNGKIATKEHEENTFHTAMQEIASFVDRWPEMAESIEIRFFNGSEPSQFDSLNQTHKCGPNCPCWMNKKRADQEIDDVIQRHKCGPDCLPNEHYEIHNYD